MREIFGITPAAVILNVYDVGTSGAGSAVNSVLKPMGFGAFHCGIQIHDKEWSYSFVSPDSTDCPTSPISGVFACRPRCCPGHSFHEAAPMGLCSISESGFWELLVKLDREWPAMGYDVLHRNCCHFCQEICSRLGLGALPSHVTKLAAAGASLASGEVQIPDCTSTAVPAACRCTTSCCGPARSMAKVEKVFVNAPAAVARLEPDVDARIAHLVGPSGFGGGCISCSGPSAGHHGYAQVRGAFHARGPVR